MKTKVLLSLAAAAALSSTTAFADQLVFSNPIQLPAFGDCSFSTTCGAFFSRGDDFAAQQFTLSSAKVLTSADFVELDLGTRPTDVNWGLIMADGTGGLPGTILAAGTDTLTGASAGSSSGYNLSKMSWDFGGVALGPGTYYLAIQAISPVIETYLGQGTLPGGAAETHDAGGSWATGYEGIPSVAVDIFAAGSPGVPEPATWVMMTLGVGLVGTALRRRRRAVPA